MPGKGRKKQNKQMKIGRCGEAVLEALTLEELVEEKNNSFGKTKKKIHRKKRYAGKKSMPAGKTARKQKHTQEKVGRWGKAVLEH